MPNRIESRVDVAIVGGGVIGLAVAWRARAKGLSVTLLEREESASGTSYVAAGMLAPVAEVEFGDAVGGLERGEVACKGGRIA